MSLSLLTPEALARDLAVRDLTDARHGPHAMQLLVDEVVTALADAWACEVRVVRAHPVVTTADNYDQLGFAPDAVTRDARYSRYVSPDTLLRTHTSALIPGALRTLAAEADPPRDVLLVCPGLVYRRDAIDRLHTGTPHQLDLWRIRQGRPTRIADLYDMIGRVVAALLPGASHRTNSVVHPYTLKGREIEALVGAGGDGDGEWVEIGECGLAGPDVLSGAGLVDASGLAMGLGLDRLLMLRKGVPDIRLLRSSDPRVSEQLLDLSPYRPVSTRPAVARDISIAVAVHADVELLGDRVRDALGDDSRSVETVEVLSETPYDELPPQAIDRIGLLPTQKNVLVRVVLRDLDRTLTADEANVLRDRAYAALHEGREHQWAT
jgi:phenylalanyl-tRNA synthetase alpha chain